ncbi:MAG: hypothetical protein OXH68_15290 [Gammaproteobacteria bacterium]|nr:hypothetical protein [Gammaproteobacteria bacterium]
MATTTRQALQRRLRTALKREVSSTEKARALVKRYTAEEEAYAKQQKVIRSKLLRAQETGNMGQAEEYETLLAELKEQTAAARESAGKAREQLEAHEARVEKIQASLKRLGSGVPIK